MENVYNDFGQLITQYLEHSGAVNTSTTPKVQYSYADGSNGYIRVTSLTYPNGREISYDYSGTTNGKLNRLTKFIDNDVSSTTLAEYKYLCLGRVIDTQYQEPAVELSHHDPVVVNGEYVAAYNWLDRILFSVRRLTSRSGSTFPESDQLFSLSAGRLGAECNAPQTG